MKKNKNKILGARNLKFDESWLSDLKFGYFRFKLNFTY